MKTKFYFLHPQATLDYPCLKAFAGCSISEEFVDNAESYEFEITEKQFIRIIESLEHSLRNIENTLWREIPNSYETAYENFEESIAVSTASYALEIAYLFNPALFKF